MSTVKERTEKSKRISSKHPGIRWAWTKQGDKFVVYSSDKKFVGMGFSLRDAKSVFAANVNEYLESLGADYRLRM